MRFFAMIFAAAVLLTACKDDNWWGDGPEPNWGVFAFEEAQTIVDVDSQTKSFKLKGHYLEPADKKRHGKVYTEFVASSSTAKPNVHFKYEFVNTFFTDFTEDADKIMHAEIPIYPENITEEVTIVYYIGIILIGDEPDKYPDAIRKTTIILRPAAKQ